jgi:hypothetical protein
MVDVIFQSRLQRFAKVLFNGPLRRRSGRWLPLPADGRPSLSRVWQQRNRKFDAAEPQGRLAFSVPRRLQRHWVVFCRSAQGPDELKSDIPCCRASKVSSRGPFIRPSDLRQSRTFVSTIDHGWLAAAGRAKPTALASAGSACPTNFRGRATFAVHRTRTAGRRMARPILMAMSAITRAASQGTRIGRRFSHLGRE